MVVAAGVIAVGAEKAFLLISFEGDAEIVTHRVDGCFQVLDKPFAGAVLGRFEQVQSAHARMAVGGEIECDGVAYVRKHFVAGRIDVRS